MLLQSGDKVLVVHRRLFERDNPRYFIGRVDAYEAGLVRVSGNSYTRDVLSGQVVEKEELRTKLLSLSSGSLIVYVLPPEVAVESIKFMYEGNTLTMTDGQGFSMNMAESAHGAL